MSTTYSLPVAVGFTAEDITKALQAVGSGAVPPRPFPLEQLLAVRQKVAQAPLLHDGVVKTAVKEVLGEAIARWQRISPDNAPILQDRYIDGLSLKETSLKYPGRHNTIKKASDIWANHLEPILHEMEQEAADAYRRHWLGQFSTSNYAQRVGTAELPAQLAAHLQTTHEPVVITGIGGLGKTTLAEAVLHHAMHNQQYVQLLRLEVASGGMNPDLLYNKLGQALGIEVQLPLETQRRILRQRLKTLPYLVLVDNLETDMTDLVVPLTELCNPSHFVVTTREQPHQRKGILEHVLQELSAEETAVLVRQEADVQQLPLAHAPAELLETIYQAVGGNPLAIILVVGLTKDASLAEVLADVRHAKQLDVREMYKRIYAKVWHAIGEKAQAVLLYFAYSDVATREEFLAFLQHQWPALTEAELMDKVGQLRQRSLLLVHGSPEMAKYQYTVHNLTKTFVQQDVMGWLHDPRST